MDDISLRVENLRKTFGDEVAVDDLSMDVKQGQLKSLLGPSGCGKTTTLRCIAGLERPDSGRIYIDGELVTDPQNGLHVEPENRGIGMVFQSYAVWPHMTVEQNVRYPLKIQKIGTKAERRQRVQEILEVVGLGEYADNLATNLSGGQQQRVAIARALVTEPAILLFDEPLSNLDAKLRREMRMEIRDIYRKFNTTILYVTHSQDEAMFLSSEIAIMNDGNIIEEGDPASLHENPETFFTMNFMGRSNTLRGRVDAVADGSATVETAIGELTSTDLIGEFQVGQEVFVCFRPKFCELHTERPDGDGQTFEGSLSMQAPTRDFSEYRISIGDEGILIRTPDPRPIDDGQTVWFTIDPSKVKTFESGAVTPQQMEVVQEAETGEDVTDIESISTTARTAVE
ncbi:MAG: ABC transporter ATP-binding protein [Halobacteriales archaeon]|nr:ABC transporter ATP-binding protein [Halobacteriales archaeon]